MPRIPDAELAKLKRDVSLVELVESSGVKLEARGKDLFGLCPFHDDHEPSLVVTPDKNLWHCLGACQAGGSVIDWVMRRDNASFRHAVEILRKGMTGAANNEAAKGNNDHVFLPSWEKEELLKETVSFYHKTLKESPECLAYLEKRKLVHPQLIDHFQLGYANRTLGYRLPDKQLKSGAAIRGKLQEIGILRESGHEHFNGSLVIPVLDENGQVTDVYGRKIRGDLRQGTPLHLYLKGQHKGVFNVLSLAASREVILCEALIDALTFWCHGFRNVTASYGVNGFTADHLAAFRRYDIQRLYVAYDNDAAGEKAAAELMEKLGGERFALYRVKFPSGLDANEYAVRVPDAAAALARLLNQAERFGPGEGATKDKIFSLAAPLPAGMEIQAEVNGDEIVMPLGDRRWRIRGLAKNLSCEQLKVNVFVGQGERYWVDSLDLYAARQRVMFVKEACRELGASEEIIKSELGKVLLKLEEKQEEQLRAKLEPKRKEVVLSDAERAAALSFLQDPKLLERILSDFEKCGVVGEETNKLVGYLAAVSRKLDNPLAIIIQSSSAAGKTWLMENILSFMPEEERVKYSAMTGQSLFYLGETDLKHKILAIVEEEGAERARYALKLLQSEGELSIASTGKDPQTGKLVTHEYKVQGPVMIFVTTTGIDIDEELQNRCILLTVNESREQTRAIHKLQREKRTLPGLEARWQRDAILKLHRDAQRLLRPLKVVNPFAPKLTFLDDRTRTRRDHDKYLNLIESIALLHQYQRPVKQFNVAGGNQEYIEVEMSDIETANRLAAEVLGRSLDELPPQTRRLLSIIEDYVVQSCQKQNIKRAEFRFSRRQVREHCHWGNTQLKVHFSRLEDLEYLLLYRGAQGHGFVYELLYHGQGKDGKPFLLGLIDTVKLRESNREYDGERSGLAEEWSGSNGQRSAPGRGQVGPKSGGGRGEFFPLTAASDQALAHPVAENAEKTHIRINGKSRSRTAAMSKDG